MALAVERVGTFPPFRLPAEGPWDLAGMQTLEDTAAQWGFTAAQTMVTTQWDWVQQYWGGTVLPPAPPVRWEWEPWAVALLVVLGPRALTAGMAVRPTLHWVQTIPAGRMPRQTPDHQRIPQPIRRQWHRIVQDVAARVQVWQQTVTDQVTTTMTGAWRAGLTLAKLREGLAAHFTGWGQEWERLIQTELSAARADALLETTRATWGVVQTHPDACSVCHRMFDGKTFRLLKTAPADSAAQALMALWPGKWTQNWDKKTRDQWPALPQHPRCRCRVVPMKDPRP